MQLKNTEVTLHSAYLQIYRLTPLKAITFDTKNTQVFRKTTDNLTPFLLCSFWIRKGKQKTTVPHLFYAIPLHFMQFLEITFVPPVGWDRQKITTETWMPPARISEHVPPSISHTSVDGTKNSLSHGT